MPFRSRKGDVEMSTAKTAEPQFLAESCKRMHAECVKGHELRVEAGAIVARARKVIARAQRHARQYRSDLERFRLMASDGHDAPQRMPGQLPQRAGSQ